MAAQVTRLFPLWALLGSLLAYLVPEWFIPLKPAIVPLLGLVMFGMGITLTGYHFLTVLRRPFPVLLGVGLQFLVMPLAAWVLAIVLALPPQLAAGLILVGCCPGGTASNVICYLARGDVALSITLTAVSTLLAIVATPLLTLLYAGQTVPVPAVDMIYSIFKIIFLPVALGVLLNHFLHQPLAAVRSVFPLLSVLAIVIIIVIIVALNREQLANIATATTLAIMAHNLTGLLGGYWIARWFGCDERECRTLSIEVGMQNSGLAVALAIKYFSVAAALPGALFSIWHNLSGSFLAGYWQRRLLPTR
ncbi:MAG: bile acid:sodium symporter family protein [Gammaproteobacteria bacterium]|nr:bile acid:sodium symporter family protein [Gammaproteobacteria bacterium]MDH3560026.1 bile acid:sodium symporter family protein [Gammaproteobacteria bacterium]